jgi:hypothetical protein
VSAAAANAANAGQYALRRQRCYHERTMGKIGVIAIPALAFVVSAGCSAKLQLHPPALGDCPPDSGCTVAPAAPGGGASPDSSAGGSGGSSGSDGSSGGNACGISFLPAGCDACMQQSCCSEVQQCSLTTECFALANCLEFCPRDDTNCAAPCMSANQGGVALYKNSLAPCMDTRCQADCLLPGGDSGTNCGNLGVSPGCSACVAAQCCTDAALCSSNTDCATNVLCVQSCLANNTPACLQTFQSCTVLNQTGQTAFQRFNDCAKASCAGLCP